jgi:hypothetical protein
MIKDLSVYYDTTGLSEVLFSSDAYFPYARFLDSFRIGTSMAAHEDLDRASLPKSNIQNGADHQNALRSTSIGSCEMFCNDDVNCIQLRAIPGDRV